MAEFRTILVTGAAKRLGRAIAVALADYGWDIAIHFNSSEAAARETVEQVQACGRRAALLKADLSDEDQTGALVHQLPHTPGEHGVIDRLLGREVGVQRLVTHVHSQCEVAKRESGEPPIPSQRVSQPSAIEPPERPS